MNTTKVVPCLTSSEYDTDKRLVGLIYESTPPLTSPGANPWLIAVDGSDNALRATAHAAYQAAAMNACALHLVHVQPWLSKEAAEMELAHRALAATAKARTMLDTAALPWRLHVAMGDPAERIIEQAVRLGATGIIIGSRGLNVTETLLFGSVTDKVMHHSPLPVMLVP
jgi:nucleotide-binding universal stress UspA family protein